MLNGTFVMIFNVKTSCLLYDRNRRISNAPRCVVVMRGLLLKRRFMLLHISSIRQQMQQE